MTFDRLMQQGNWTPIRDCPGRFVLRGAKPNLGIAELIDDQTEVQEHHSIAAKDPVWVAQLEDEGVIFYRSHSGKWTHTLNTPEGFSRKLKQPDIHWVSKGG